MGQDLQAQVERFGELTGKYPELVQVDDMIYLTRKNRRFLKEKEIPFTEESLGRKPGTDNRSVKAARSGKTQSS